MTGTLDLTTFSLVFAGLLAWNHEAVTVTVSGPAVSPVPPSPFASLETAPPVTPFGVREDRGAGSVLRNAPVGWGRPWFAKAGSSRGEGTTIDPSVVRPLAESLADRFAAWPFQPGSKNQTVAPWDLLEPPLEYVPPPVPQPAADAELKPTEPAAIAGGAGSSATRTQALRVFNPATSFLDLIPPEDRDRDGFGVAITGVDSTINADGKRLNLDILDSNTVWGGAIPGLILQKKTLQNRPTAPERNADDANDAEAPNNAARDARRSGTLLGVGGCLILGLLALRGVGLTGANRRLTLPGAARR